MRKQMIENAAYEVATQVRAVEDSIEAALAELAELQSKMVHARSRHRRRLRHQPRRFRAARGALTSGLVAARGGIADCHAALVETKQTRSPAFAPSASATRANARQGRARRPARRRLK